MLLFSSLENATDGVEKEEETEVQIPAAAIDLTGASDDLEEGAAGIRDGDCSSYKVDDSDTAAMAL